MDCEIIKTEKGNVLQIAGTHEVVGRFDAATGVLTITNPRIADSPVLKGQAGTWLKTQGFGIADAKGTKSIKYAVELSDADGKVVTANAPVADGDTGGDGGTGAGDTGGDAGCNDATDTPQDTVTPPPAPPPAPKSSDGDDSGAVPDAIARGVLADKVAKLTVENERLTTENLDLRRQNHELSVRLENLSLQNEGAAAAAKRFGGLMSGQATPF